MRILFPDGHEEEIPARGRTIEAVLLGIGMNPAELLISRGETIIPEDTIGIDEDTIRLIRISHGG